MKKVEKGNKVKVEYTGKFDDGTVFDTSEGREPLEVEVGAGRVIKGFDDALSGMKKGDEKEIKIKPEEGYGMPNPELVKEIRRDNLPKEPEPKEGMVLIMKTPDGNQFPAKISKVEGDKVTIDLNHPLAGKNLNFKIKVVEVAEG